MERKQKEEEEGKGQERAAAFFRDFPVRQAWGGHSRGRYVVSARHIKRGEVVLEALPYALAPKLPSRTCARCFRYQGGDVPSWSSSRQAEDEDEDEGLEESEGPLRPCSGDCGAFYCSAQEEAEDREAGHGLECAAWRRVRQAGPSMGLTESEQTELRLAFRIVARHHAACNAARFLDDQDSDCVQLHDAEATTTTQSAQLIEPTFEDVMGLCSNRERRPLEEIAFWRRVVERMVTPLNAEEHSLEGGVPWSRYDFVELIGKNLCNGFGLRGSGGECYAYGTYPGASYFNHSCYPNVCRVDQEACLSSGGKALSIRFVALVDINPGHEVTLSYIDASKSTEHRRLALSTIYFFHCMCIRCEGRTKHSKQKGKPPKDDYVQRFVCRSCTKNNGRGVLYPFSPTHDRCNLCHKLVARNHQQKRNDPSRASPTPQASTSTSGVRAAQPNAVTRQKPRRSRCSVTNKQT